MASGVSASEKADVVRTEQLFQLYVKGVRGDIGRLLFDSLKGVYGRDYIENTLTVLVTFLMWESR